jgi:hypothetical protein
MKQYALCLSNDFGDGSSGDYVLPDLVYETLGEERGMLRIIDESGKYFLHLAKQFNVLTDAQSAQLERVCLPQHKSNFACCA